MDCACREHWRLRNSRRAKPVSASSCESSESCAGLPRCSRRLLPWRCQRQPEIPLCLPAGYRRDPLSRQHRLTAHPSQGKTCGSRSSHQATQLQVAFSFLALPHHGQVRQELAPLLHLGNRVSLFEQCACGTNVNALAATGARFRIPPWFAQIGHDLRIDTPAHYVPGVRALDLVAYPNTTRAQNAAIVVNDKAFVRGIDLRFRISVREVNVRETEFLRQRLKITVSVRNAN